jgi:Glycosyltransferase family 87
MKIAVILLCSILFLVVVALLPLPLPPYLDFQVIYHADLGLLRGISIYDHTGQVNMIAGLAHVPPDQVYVLPFPYPPWYALVTLWVALLPIVVSVRIWFGLNLLMLFASTWLLTDGWVPVRRLVSFFFAILFLPVLGTLWVGQYGLPVLLGAALFVYALHHEKVALAALAAALLTFKPHLGGLILLIGLVYLFLRRDDFGRRALVAIVLAGIFLFAIGFLASPLWPLDYFHSLTGFKDVSQCHQCNSVPMELTGLVRGGFDQAVWIALGILVFLAGWVASQWKLLTHDSRWLVGISVLVVLVASPYLQNYDYVLLLVPLFILASGALRLDWLWLALAYLLPFLGFGLFGVSGEVSLVISALIVFTLFTNAMSKLDVSAGAAYNLITTK